MSKGIRSDPKFALVSAHIDDECRNPIWACVEFDPTHPAKWCLPCRVRAAVAQIDNLAKEMAKT